LSSPFDLLFAGAVCFDMRAVRSVGGVVADQVVIEGVLKVKTLWVSGWAGLAFYMRFIQVAAHECACFSLQATLILHNPRNS
jgi:hypothetical protein